MKYFYEIWDNGNWTCWKGKVMIVTEWKKFLGTCLLVNVPFVAHYVVHFGWFVNQGRFEAAALLLICHFLIVLSLLKIFATDRGIIVPIVRNVHSYSTQYELDSDLAEIPPNSKMSAHDGFSYLFISKTHCFKYKFCITCNIFRPPRTYHCNTCGHCIERFDHHCSWLGTCIGKRNYRNFYLFLFALSTAVIVVVWMCSVILVDGTDIVNSFKGKPATIVLIIYTILFGVFILAFFGFHTYLSIINTTTYEFLKKLWERESGNPFSKHCFFKNFINICWKFPKSMVNLRKEIFEDHEQSSKHSEAADNRRAGKEEVAPQPNVSSAELHPVAAARQPAESQVLQSRIPLVLEFPLPSTPQSQASKPAERPQRRLSQVQLPIP